MGVVVMGFVGFDCFFYVVALWPVVVVMGFVGVFFFFSGGGGGGGWQ